MSIRFRIISKTMDGMWTTLARKRVRLVVLNLLPLMIRSDPPKGKTKPCFLRAANRAKWTMAPLGCPHVHLPLAPTQALLSVRTLVKVPNKAWNMGRLEHLVCELVTKNGGLWESVQMSIENKNFWWLERWQHERHAVKPPVFKPFGDLRIFESCRLDDWKTPEFAEDQ